MRTSDTITAVIRDSTKITSNVRLLRHTSQGSHAIAITARVDSAELAVESVRNIICSLPRFGRRNEIFARDSGNNLANSVILQNNEIAIVIREAVFCHSGCAGSRTAAASSRTSDCLFGSSNQATGTSSLSLLTHASASPYRH